MTKAIPHFDWLTFNNPISYEVQSMVHWERVVKQKAITDAILLLRSGGLFVGSLETVKPRPPFTEAHQHIETGTRLSFSHKFDKTHIEISGKGCKTIHEQEGFNRLLNDVRQGVTRLDYAVDFLSNVCPKEFATAGYSGNIKTQSIIESETGTTVYIGSWKSDRFLRVYRYKKPHPRYRLLRCEFVFKRGYTKPVIDKYLIGGHSALMEAITNAWKFRHPLWTQSIMTPEEAQQAIGWERERKVSNTMQWLENTVIPSIKRMVQEGEIDDPIQWLIAHLDDDDTISGD